VYHHDLGMWFLFNAKERTLDEFKTLGQVPSTILSCIATIDGDNHRANAGLAITGVHDLVETMVMEFRIA
jgi:hypothetical protein